MKIGVIGSGDVGRTLAAGFLKHGHEVVIGSRTAGKLDNWAKEHAGARAGSFAVAAEALRLAGAENLRGKTVLDACNPSEDAPPVNGVLKLFTKMDDSLMEQLQKEFADAKFVKAFNSVGAALMVNPQLKGGKPTMFICGNDEGAKKIATGILDQFGWETEDMGKVEGARAIEPLCMLWCIPGFLHNQWTHAFKLLRD
jgi:predicted dinucleotide-binding enzyme